MAPHCASRSREAGFSTVDVLIAIMLTGLVLAFATTGVAQYMSASKNSEIRDDALRIGRAIEASYAGNGYPADLAALNAALPRYRITLPSNSRIKWYVRTAASSTAPEGYALCVESGPSGSPDRYAAYSSTALAGSEGRSSGKGACPTTPVYRADTGQSSATPSASPSATPSPTTSSTPTPAGLACPNFTLTGSGGPGNLTAPLRTLAANWPAVPGAVTYNLKLTIGSTGTTNSYTTTTNSYSWSNLSKTTYTVLITAADTSGESPGCTSKSYTFTN